jgi:hemin uptake protein HemP
VELSVVSAPFENPRHAEATSTQEGGIDLRTLSSDELLHGQREVLIRHGSEVYRLRLTRQGKLILQK